MGRFIFISSPKLTTCAGSSSSLLNHHVKGRHKDITTPSWEATDVKSEVKEVDIAGMVPSSDQETKPEEKVASLINSNKSQGRNSIEKNAFGPVLGPVLSPVFKPKLGKLVYAF